MRISIENVSVVSCWLSEYIKKYPPRKGVSRPRNSALLVLLFGGDRLTCCDEAVITRDASGRIVGLVTLAPDGEMSEGPALIGLYVLPEYRRQGIGTRLITRAVERMAERGLVPVQMDLLSTAAAKLVEQLPAEVHSNIRVTLQLWMIDFLLSEVRMND